MRRKHPNETVPIKPEAVTSKRKAAVLHISPKTRVKRLVSYAEVRGLNVKELEERLSIHSADDKVNAAMNWFESKGIKVTEEMITRDGLKASADESRPRPVRTKSDATDPAALFRVGDPPDTIRKARPPKRKPDQTPGAPAPAAATPPAATITNGLGTAKTTTPAGAAASTQIGAASGVIDPVAPLALADAPKQAIASAKPAAISDAVARGHVPPLSGAAKAQDAVGAGPATSTPTPVQVGPIAAASQQFLTSDGRGSGKAHSPEDAVARAQERGKARQQAAAAPQNAPKKKEFRPNIAAAKQLAQPAAAAAAASASSAPTEADASASSPAVGAKRPAGPVAVDDQSQPKRLKIESGADTNTAAAASALAATTRSGESCPPAPTPTDATELLEKFLQSLPGLSDATKRILRENTTLEELIDGVFDKQTLTELGVKEIDAKRVTCAAAKRRVNLKTEPPH